MNRDDFHNRRAKSGKGAKRKAALQELWFANDALTHAIIGNVAGDPRGEEKKRLANLDIELWTKVLLDITHPPKDELKESCLVTFRRKT